MATVAEINMVYGFVGFWAAFGVLGLYVAIRGY
jgi:hypothetical protein